MTYVSKESIEELINKGYSQRKIAKELRIDRSVLQKILMEHGLKTLKSTPLSKDTLEAAIVGKIENS